VSGPPADRQALHTAFVARLAGLVRQGGVVLDASRGAGQYRAALLAAGLRVTGVALPDLTTRPDRFDGLLCIGALQEVTPEDWPATAARLAAVLKHGAPAYLTVELPPPDQVRRWLTAAGFAVTDEADAGHCWHLLLARTTAR
jgi:hypothetical protein